MFFLWIRSGNYGKGYYLPDNNNWSSRLSIGSDILGINHQIDLPININEGCYTVSLPPCFQWAEGCEDGHLEHCRLLTMHNESTHIEIYSSLHTKEESVFTTYEIPPFPLTIGSKEDNTICCQEQGVSRYHATLTYRSDGIAQITDHSRNGVFINGCLCHNSSQELRFGDSIVILPKLHLVYLGSHFAINNCLSSWISNSIKPYIPHTSSEHTPNNSISVIQEYHRSPRHIQQPKTDEITIDPPLDKSQQKELPTWLTIGPSMTMVLPMLVSAVASNRSIVTSLAMVGTSSALAVMWGLINRRYQRQNAELTESNRLAICKQYYAEMEENLSADTERERRRLLYNYLSADECIALADAHRLWERMPSHEDFLSVRLGLGEHPLPAEIKVAPLKISLTDDPLRHEPQRLYDQYHMMHDVPVLLSLLHNQIIGVLGHPSDPWLIQSILVQIAANHSYHDVRIAAIHENENAKQWAFAKWLPHVYTSDDRSMRMVSHNKAAIQSILTHIDSVLSMRADMQTDKDKDESIDLTASTSLPWYVIFCTSPKLIEDHPIIRHLTSSGLGFTVILQAPSMELLPKECNAIIDARDHLGAVYMPNGEMKGVHFESANEHVLHHFSQNLASIRIKEAVENSAIPSMVTFLESYNARKVEDLDICYFWNENHAFNSVESLLGMKAGSVPFTLDISDKNHGPHGLIAGTTGAGKSVLLQTFILSLAINYSPQEVQFILIDYKGGGTSEDFRSLPHAVGIIDSLDGERLIYRALASIKGEILRREEIFKSVGVNNIDDYMKYFNNDPNEPTLGHLIIIVDEFAELKKEQPEFMTELVSTARVGRSLGMHLVLATQKPTNAVGDDIQANTRFRICLRVASKADSSEMLKRPDAAYLKGSGRCYVQVGSDEIFEQVQTSYSGSVYNPNALRPEEEPRLINESGHLLRIQRKKNRSAESQGGLVKAITELNAVLDYINWTCEHYHFERGRRMWLDELPRLLTFDDIPPIRNQRFLNGVWPESSGNELTAYFGMADDVAMQRYLPVAINFTKDKNHIISGLSGTGKTIILQSIAVSLALRYTPDELNVYVFSLTSRMLSSLESLPHVGDVVYEDEPDEQVRLIEMLSAECDRRKKLFALKATDNYTQYNRAVQESGEQTVPAIVVLVDRIQQLRDWANERKEDKLQLFYDMLRSANSQGIYFVLTALERNELPAKYQPFVHGIALQMNDRIGYAEALGARIPAEWGGIREYPGRGMVAFVQKDAKSTQLFEIQTAVFCTTESDAKRSEAIMQLGREMHAAWLGTLPKQIARIPKEAMLSDLLVNQNIEQDLTAAAHLPLFYIKNKGIAQSINLRETFSMLICGSRKSGKTNTIKNIASTFAKKNAIIHIVGNADLVEWAKQHGMNGYLHGDAAWDEMLKKLYPPEITVRSNILKAARARGGVKERERMLDTFTPVVLLIDDADLMIAKYEQNREILDTLKLFCAPMVSGYALYTYMTVSHASLSRCKGKEPIASMINAKRGLMLQGKLSECDPFNVQIPYNKKNESYPVGEALYVSEDSCDHVVIPQWNDT